MPIDVLLVDHHAATRESFRMMIESAGGFRVVGEARSYREAIDLQGRTNPDLIVMDVFLPGLDGIETTADIVRLRPTTKVVMLSIEEDQARVVAALRAGASGYILKNAAPGDVVEGLRQICQGTNYFSPSVARHLMERFQNGMLNEPADFSNLSRRQMQVLRLVVEGRTCRQVADTLDLETGTVRTYRKNLMRKLDVRNAAELTRVAMAMGIVQGVQPASGAAAGSNQ